MHCMVGFLDVYSMRELIIWEDVIHSDNRAESVEQNCRLRIMLALRYLLCAEGRAPGIGRIIREEVVFELALVLKET